MKVLSGNFTFRDCRGGERIGHPDKCGYLRKPWTNGLISTFRGNKNLE